MPNALPNYIARLDDAARNLQREADRAVDANDLTAEFCAKRLEAACIMLETLAADLNRARERAHRMRRN